MFLHPIQRILRNSISVSSSNTPQPQGETGRNQRTLGKARGQRSLTRMKPIFTAVTHDHKAVNVRRSAYAIHLLLSLRSLKGGFSCLLISWYRRGFQWESCWLFHYRVNAAVSGCYGSCHFNNRGFWTSWALYVFIQRQRRKRSSRMTA